MRGGISMVSKRHAKANNPYVKGFDQAGQWNNLMYLDENNLYGHAMSQELLYADSKWVDPNSKQQPGRERIYEVDLEYPQHLHKRHNGYPLAPETITVDEKWLHSTVCVGQVWFAR